MPYRTDAFPADPRRPTCPTGFCARSTGTMDHRGRVRPHGAGDPRRPQGRVPDQAPVVIYPASARRWRRARQHALAGRSRAHVRDRAFRFAVAQDGDEARPLVDLVPTDWRRGVDPVRSGQAQGRSDSGSRPVRRAQRDFDRSRIPHRRDTQGDRCGKHPALTWSTRFPACLDRLPPRRVVST